MPHNTLVHNGGQQAIILQMPPRSGHRNYLSATEVPVFCYNPILMANKPLRVLLLGSNSGRNAGDAALLETVIEQIEKRRPGTVFEVPTTHPRFVRQHFGSPNVIPVPILPWNLSMRLLGLPVVRSMRRCDISLVLDGIIFDHRLYNPAFNFLITLVFLAPYAKRLGRPMVCFEVGIGPLKKRMGRLFARIVGDACDLILVREKDSERLLLASGVRKTPIEVYADAAFISKPAPPEKVEELIKNLDAGGRPLVGLNLTRYGGSWVGKDRQFDRSAFQTKMAGFIDEFTRATGSVVVLTGTQIMDREYLVEVQKLVRNRDSVRMISNLECSPGELAGVMGKMELFIGMRLHSLILASSVKTPILGLTYAPKVRSLFEMMGRPELALDLGSFDIGAFVDHVLSFWADRGKERDRLAPYIDIFKKKANSGFDRLVEEYF